MVTSAEGCCVSTISKVAARPASDVSKPAIGVTVIPAVWNVDGPALDSIRSKGSPETVSKKCRILSGRSARSTVMVSGRGCWRAREL